MTKTIDELVECVMLDIIPPFPVIADYFGLENANNIENLSTILGLYQGMIKIKGMKKEKVEKAFHENKLDKLIHISYKKYGGSGYYKKFCEENIKIGNTYF